MAGGLERDVEFVDADHGLDDVTSPEAQATTIRLVPR
jgi:hypothetical protein